MRYEEEYKRLHTSGVFAGYSLLHFADNIYNMIKDTGSYTVLDYGSGKGYQYSKKKIDLYWGVEVDCYDPGYEPFNTLPNKMYDGVVCTEVMEHIPEDEIDNAMYNIFARANKFVFLSVSLVPAAKTFTNGDNVHVTLKTKEWWNEKIDRHNTKGVPVNVVFSD